MSEPPQTPAEQSQVVDDRPQQPRKVQQQLQFIERIEAVNRQVERGTADIAYMSEPLTRMHFPMDKPDASMLIFERRDGNKNMRIIAHPEYGLPYGSDDLRV